MLIKFCYDHLANCENFKKRYDESECAEILALGNDDNNKNNKDNEKEKVSSINSINLITYCMIFNLLLFSTNGIESSNHT